MKLAWLIWDEGDLDPIICFYEPSSWYYSVVPIVYTEIKENDK